MRQIQRNAPIGGWNARDAEADMPPEDAIILTNWIPRQGFCETRKGYQEIADFSFSFGESLGTLTSFRADSDEWLVAFSDDNIYSYHPTAGTNAEHIAGQSTDQWWNVTQFNNLLICCNGTNAPVALSPSGIALNLSLLSITGPTASDLWGCNTFKGRVYYWEENSSSFWYAGVGAYQGTLTEFPLDRVADKGGRLIQMVNLTNDGGAGTDDLAVFIMSTGQALAYQGDDPGSANAWQLIGKFQIGEPLGPRAHAQVGGNQIILTRDGWVGLRQALTEARFGEQSAFSFKINRAAKDAAATNAQYEGWQAVTYPAGNLFIVNIPTSADAATADQHVRVTDTGAWCKFEDYPATNFAVFDSELYFATESGKVMKADAGLNDDNDPITAVALPSFVRMGKESRMSAVRHHIDFEFTAFIRTEAHKDFNTSFRGTVSQAVGPSAESIRVRKPRRSVKANGTYLTASCSVKTKLQQTKWYATELHIAD